MSVTASTSPASSGTPGDRLQVLFLGSSADTDALRRSLESRGAVTRTRLTPEVAAVVADETVGSDHPTLYAAESLGVPVLRRAEAVEQLAAWMARPAGSIAIPDHGQADRSTTVIVTAIAILLIALATIGILGAVL